MSDKDFEVLQTALSPEVSESEEQVCPYYYCIPNLQVFSEAVDWGGKRAADFCHCPIKQLRVIDLKVSLRMLYC